MKVKGSPRSKAYADSLCQRENIFSVGDDSELSARYQGGSVRPFCGRCSIWLRLVAVFSVVFGLLSIFSGGSVLFGSDEVRRAAGATIGFIVWSNFLGGFAYVAAGAGLWLRQRWAVPLAFAIAGAIVLVAAAFGMHVANGGAYEMRTVGAMGFRLGAWLIISMIAYRSIWCPRPQVAQTHGG